MKKLAFFVLFLGCNTADHEEDTVEYAQDLSQEEGESSTYDQELLEEEIYEWDVQEDQHMYIYDFEDPIFLDMQSPFLNSLRAERLHMYFLTHIPVQDESLLEGHSFDLVEEGRRNMPEEDVVGHILEALEYYDAIYIPLRAERIQEPLWEVIMESTDQGLLCYDVEGTLLQP